MSDQPYHDHPAISRSELVLFEESRQLYYHTYVTRRLEQKRATKAMELGTLCHAMFLEAKRFEDLVIELPKDCLKENGDINPKPTGEFRKQHPDAILCKPSQYRDWQARSSLIMSAIDTVLTLPAKANREQAVFANLYGLNMKCKPDADWIEDGAIRCVDLKITNDASPDAFKRSAKRFKYHLQDSHYSAVLHRKHNLPVAFSFVVVEDTFPFRVAEYNYDHESRGLSSSYHADLCNEIYKCQKENDWSEKWDTTLSVAPWECGGVPVLEGFENDD